MCSKMIIHRLVVAFDKQSIGLIKMMLNRFNSTNSTDIAVDSSL